MDDTDTQTQEKPLAGFKPLAEFLTDAGFPTSASTMAKYCSPGVNIGPPVAGYWGRLPMFLPSRALAWARARSGLGTSQHTPDAA